MAYTIEIARSLLKGPLADRPAATVGRYWYLATDEDGGTLYKSDGAVWVQASAGVSGGGGSPTGSAGGDLGGTYPNPDVAIVDDGVLGSGTPDNTKFLRGDRTWAVPAGGAPSGSAGGALDGTYPNPGLAAAVAGAGLAEALDVLSVNVDGSTLEINADALRVKADGITANEIAANAVGSSELADNAVDSGAIAANAVTNAKLNSDVYATPAVALGSAAAAGAAATVIRSDSTIAAFDANNPAAEAFGDAAAVGTAAFAARRDHKHAMPSNADVETAYNAIVAAVTQAQAEAGTSTSILRWTPERVAQAIAALGFAPNVAVQVKTDTSGTYTPSSGMVKVLVICVGGGGGAPAETVADAAVSGGGGGGAAIKLFSAATIGASQAYAVGQTSTGGGNTSGLGTANALLQATGGAVGVSTGLSTTLGQAVQGGLGGIGTLGDLNIRGGPGGDAVIYSASAGKGGNGGNSIFGGGGRGGVTITTVQQGEAGGAYGGGAGGGHTSDGTDLSAVAGAAGVIYFIEFLKAGAGTAAAGQPGGSELIYKYTVTGSDKATIDTGVDTASAGSLDWTNGDLLEIYVYARTDEAVTNSSIALIFNNDSSSIYDQSQLRTVNTTLSGVASVARANWTSNLAGASAAANVFGVWRITVPNYNGTVGFKVGEMIASIPDTTAANTQTAALGAEWRSTAAINRVAISVVTAAKLFKVGTQILIYKRKSV